MISLILKDAFLRTLKMLSKYKKFLNKLVSCIYLRTLFNKLNIDTNIFA